MKGIDLSSNNVVTPEMLKAWHDAGYSFIVHRLNVGKWVDPTFNERWNMIGDAGFYRSFYSVVLPLTNAKEQLDTAFNALGNRVTDFSETLDCEVIYDRNAGRNATPEEVDKMVGSHVAGFEDYFKSKPLIYANQYYGGTYLKSNHGCDLWISWVAAGGAYNPAPVPAIPQHWTLKQLRFWQRSWKQKLPLSTKDYDLDEWQGTEEEFRVWAKIDNPPTDRIKDLEDQVIKLQAWVRAHDNAPSYKPLMVPFTLDSKTPARFIKGTNKVGKFMFEIYPGDGAPTEERKFFAGTIMVSPTPIVGDSGVTCYYVYSGDPQPFFVRVQDGHF